MWVELESAEVDQIVEALGPGRLVEKLTARPHHQTGAFVKAAAKKVAAHSEDVMIERCGIIERGDFGAWVMAWLWVTEKEADVPDVLRTSQMAIEDQRLAEALPSFRTLDIDRADGQVLAHGEMRGFEWHFETIGPVWTLAAYAQEEKHADWFHVEEWRDGVSACTMTYRDVLTAIVRSLRRIVMSQVAHPTPRHPILWRKYLDLYALDVIGEEEAVKWLNVSVELLRQKAQPIRGRVETLRKAGEKVVLVGPGVPRFDIEATD
jgi:hypothetical protein